MIVKLHSNNQFQFSAENEDGFSIKIGAATSIGGDGQGFRPMQLVLAAVGSCSGIDILNILKKQRQAVEDLQIEVIGLRAEDKIPSPFTEINIKYKIIGKQLNLDKAKKAAELSMEKYCSVSEMLKEKVKINYTVSVTEI